MNNVKPILLLKPTLDTKFHIDYEWWERGEEDLKPYLLTHLPPDKRDAIASLEVLSVADVVDAETGEVLRLDELGVALREASKQADFINPQTSLVDSVFRAFLANGNTPRSPRELAIDTARDANTILKTFTGTKIYKGIRPYIANS